MAKKRRRDPTSAPSAAQRDTPRAADKKRRREERQLAELQATIKARRIRRVRNVGAAVVGVVAIAVVGFLFFRPDPELAGVEKPRYAGTGHLAAGAYDTATPTSGAHAPGAPRCGIYNEELTPSLAVHALEHGTVVVWYRPDLEEPRYDALESLVRSWPSHVILSPNTRLDDPIVATAWNRLKRYDLVGEDLREFIEIYRRRGPESIDCPL